MVDWSAKTWCFFLKSILRNPEKLEEIAMFLGRWVINLHQWDDYLNQIESVFIGGNLTTYHCIASYHWLIELDHKSWRTNAPKMSGFVCWKTSLRIESIVYSKHIVNNVLISIPVWNPRLTTVYSVSSMEILFYHQIRICHVTITETGISPTKKTSAMLGSSRLNAGPLGRSVMVSNSCGAQNSGRVIFWVINWRKPSKKPCQLHHFLQHHSSSVLFH